GEDGGPRGGGSRGRDAEREAVDRVRAGEIVDGRGSEEGRVHVIVGRRRRRGAVIRVAGARAQEQRAVELAGAGAYLTGRDEKKEPHPFRIATGSCVDNCGSWIRIAAP